MVDIAVCTDSNNDLILVKNLLEKYSAKRHINFSIVTYKKTEPLLFDLSEKNGADIYIIDISPMENNWLTLTHTIREAASNAVIILISSRAEQAINGYKINALRYIVKTSLDNDIEEALDSAIAELKKPDKLTVTLRYYNDFQKILYSDIISVSKVARQLVITTYSQGELKDHRGITEFFDILNDNRFIFIDRSCFVNIDYILKVDGCSIKLKNGQVLPISRRQLSNVRQIITEKWSL